MRAEEGGREKAEQERRLEKIPDSGRAPERGEWPEEKGKRLNEGEAKEEGSWGSIDVKCEVHSIPKNW
jgi:hypothetical protein